MFLKDVDANGIANIMNKLYLMQLNLSFVCKVTKFYIIQVGCLLLVQKAPVILKNILSLEQI